MKEKLHMKSAIRKPVISQVKIISILIDSSYSTKKILPKLVNMANDFISTIRNFKHVKVFISVAFFSTDYKVYSDFIDAKLLPIIQCPSSSGCTNMGAAIVSDVTRTMDFYRNYKESNVNQLVSAPALFFFTDGYNDPGVNASERDIDYNQKYFQQASNLIHSLETDHPCKADKLNFYAVGLKNDLGSVDEFELEKLTLHKHHIVSPKTNDELLSLFNSMGYWTQTSF